MLVLMISHISGILAVVATALAMPCPSSTTTDTTSSSPPPSPAATSVITLKKEEEKMATMAGPMEGAQATEAAKMIGTKNKREKLDGVDVDESGQPLGKENQETQGFAQELFPKMYRVSSPSSTLPRLMEAA
ncbi:hypothetical protein MKZ38_004881 [Zalerion maritima]|uniref:Secreted protein n=1 Tax=Zalerion maritima TaxID=339359 RepID=A0AAD5RY90_9PEZI|nr:hypothetical protein MKZ38_004881 [Zalerion maritima]